jgi:hypothetical protein
VLGQKLGLATSLVIQSLQHSSGTVELSVRGVVDDTATSDTATLAITAQTARPTLHRPQRNRCAMAS